MNKWNPRVSIGMPVYNGERFLPLALDSLLAQTFVDFELIISDNASTDRTAEICQAYAARDQRIRYSRNDTNIGAPRNLNRVFELATAPYFKWAAHDDLCDPDLVRRCVEVLDADPSVVVCHPRSRIIDEHGQVIRDYPYNGKLATDASAPHTRLHQLLRVYHWCLQPHGVTRSTALQQTALFGLYPSGDRVLLAHLGLLGRFHELPDTLFSFRDHRQPSMALSPHPYLYALLLDPAKQGKIVFPVWRLLGELFRVVRQTSLSPTERVWCNLILAGWTVRGLNSARLGRDVLVASIIATKQLLRVAPTHKSSHV